MKKIRGGPFFLEAPNNSDGYEPNSDISPSPASLTPLEIPEEIPDLENVSISIFPEQESTHTILLSPIPEIDNEDSALDTLSHHTPLISPMSSSDDGIDDNYELVENDQK